MDCSRRDFTRLLLAAPALMALDPGPLRAQVKPARPNSRWAGVQVGLNVPYSFGTRTAMNGEEILARCLTLGISAVELRGQAIELSLGLPPELVLGPAPSDYESVYATGAKAPEAAGNAMAVNAPTRTRLTPEAIAKYREDEKALRKWRLSLAMDKAFALRKKYEDAGVKIEIVKFDGISEMQDDDYEYIFTLAKMLGARTVSGEFSMVAAQRMAVPSQRHKIWAGLHNHLAVTPAIWEEAFAYGPFIGANVDIGHYMAGNGVSPAAFIAKHHERVTHLHVKDKTLDNHNVEFGQGATPIRALLQQIRDNRWSHIQATIEYEIPLKDETRRMAELQKSIDYCRQCLIA